MPVPAERRQNTEPVQDRQQSTRRRQRRFLPGEVNKSHGGAHNPPSLDHLSLGLMQLMDGLSSPRLAPPTAVQILGSSSLAVRVQSHAHAAGAPSYSTVQLGLGAE